MSEFSKLIKARRKRSLRDDCKAIGISQATLSRIENGNIPDLETFKKIRDWIDMDADYLIDMIFSDSERTEIK